MKKFLSNMMRGIAVAGALAGSADIAKAEKPGSTEQQIDIQALSKSTVTRIMKILKMPAGEEEKTKKKIESLVASTLERTAKLRQRAQVDALRMLVEKAKEKIDPQPSVEKLTETPYFNPLDHIKGGMYPPTPKGEDDVQGYRMALDGEIKDLYESYVELKQMDPNSTEAKTLRKTLDARREGFNKAYKVEFLMPG